MNPSKPPGPGQVSRVLWEPSRFGIDPRQWEHASASQRDDPRAM